MPFGNETLVLKWHRIELNNLVEREKVSANKMIAEWKGWAERFGVIPWDELVNIARW